MSSNPVFNRIEKDAREGYVGFEQPRAVGTDPLRGASAGYATTEQVTAERLEQMYSQPTAGPVQTGRLTMDDVVIKALGLFAIVVVVGAAGWQVASANPSLGFALWMGGMIGTLILGLVIAFKKGVSVPLIVGYAVLEGVFVGAVSQVFNQRYPGIVVTAVLATVATFAGMFGAYYTGLIKVTDKFRRTVTMMIFGYVIFAVVNFVYAMVTNTPFGFGGSGTLGIAISLFAVGLASVSLALDFDSIDKAIRFGAPQKYSWLLAHGLIVTLVWLYIEFLRLIARMRD